MTIALTCNTRTRLKVNPLSRMQSPGTEAGYGNRLEAHVVDRVFHIALKGQRPGGRPAAAG